MMAYVQIRRGRWLAALLGILGLATAALAQVLGGNPIQLRGPPLNTRPPNQQITLTDPLTGQMITFGSIPQHVQIMPGKPTKGPLDNGSLGNYPIQGLP